MLAEWVKELWVKPWVVLWVKPWAVLWVEQWLEQCQVKPEVWVQVVQWETWAAWVVQVVQEIWAAWEVQEVQVA